MPFGTKPSSSGTSHNLPAPLPDHIFPQQQPAPVDLNASALLQQPADGHLVSSVPQSSLPPPSPTGRATVTIATLDARLPVFLWSSLNDWRHPLPMMSLGKDTAGRYNHICEIDNVPGESFLYKVRVDNEWILDEEKPIARDGDGNVNNIGYAQHAFGEPVQRQAQDPPAGSSVQKELSPARGSAATAKDSDNETVQLEESSEPDWGSPLVRHESLQAVQKDQQEAPLLRHESFRVDADREQPANAFRRGPFPRSPSMSTIEEESAEASDTLSQVFQTDKPTAYEQAREYQRALIEAMPNSIANGFTRASVLLPADAHTQAGGVQVATDPLSSQVDELEQGPLLGHETGLEHLDYDHHEGTHEMNQAPSTSSVNEERSELDQAPLLRHETHGSEQPPDVGDTQIETQHPSLFDEYTLSHEAGETSDDDGAFEWRRQVAIRYTAGSESSMPSSRISDQMVFPLELGNLSNAHRSSSAYSEDWVTDESDRSDWESGAVNVMLYGRCGPQPLLIDDEDDVNELNRAPTMAHEAEDKSRPGSPGEEEAPKLQHEPGYTSQAKLQTRSNGRSLERGRTLSTDTRRTSERSQTRRILIGETNMLSSSKRNSVVDPHRLQEAFNGRIFGATRRRTSSQNDENNETGLGGAPLLAHECSFPVDSHSSSDNLGDMAGGFRRPSNDVLDFLTFTQRSAAASFRPQGSLLPHRLPRLDQDDSNLRDQSLEVFPTDRHGLLTRVSDISRRLPEDVVASSPIRCSTILSQACSSIDLGPNRSASTMSLQSIQEDTVEEEAQDSQPSSPVMMFASRVTGIPQSFSPVSIRAGAETKTPVPRNEQRGYFETQDDASMPTETGDDDQPSVRRRVPVSKRPTIQYEEDEGLDDTDDTKRYGKVFAALALPPNPPKAGLTLPPRASMISFIEPRETNIISECKSRQRTPYPHEEDGPAVEEVRGGNIVRTICRHLFSCMPTRSASIFIVGFFAAGAALWWRRR